MTATDSGGDVVVQRRSQVTVVVAWVLLGGCLALLGSLLVWGERPASYADLRAAVAQGRVDQVRIVGGLADREARGFATAEVQWRDRLTDRVTTVIEATPRVRTDDAPDGVPVLRERVDDDLRALDQDLVVIRADEALSGYGEVFGWRVPELLVLPALGLGFAVLAFLVRGPQPWRATRWAWFWLIVGVPFAALAFLLVGGANGRWPPAEPERRLTGGWAFLLSLILGAAWGTVLVTV